MPTYVAMTLTYPERVTPSNIEIMRKLILNGPNKHPGANFIRYKGKNRWYLGYADRKSVAQKLEVMHQCNL